MNLRNQRPKVRQGRPLTITQRQRISQRGAQYSPSMEKWIGWLFDGATVTVFEPRTTRERALQDARQHYDRIFHPEAPVSQWTGQS